MNFLFNLLLIIIFWEVLTIKNIILLSIFYFCYLILLSLNEDNYQGSGCQPRSFTPTKFSDSDDDSY